MLDEARIDRDSARRERYAARRAHERPQRCGGASWAPGERAS
jgi:hypothetical protein